MASFNIFNPLLFDKKSALLVSGKKNYCEWEIFQLPPPPPPKSKIICPLPPSSAEIAFVLDRWLFGGWGERKIEPTGIGRERCLFFLLLIVLCAPCLAVFTSPLPSIKEAFAENRGVLLQKSDNATINSNKINMVNTRVLPCVVTRPCSPTNG